MSDEKKDIIQYTSQTATLQIISPHKRLDKTVKSRLNPWQVLKMLSQLMRTDTHGDLFWTDLTSFVFFCLVFWIRRSVLTGNAGRKFGGVAVMFFPIEPDCRMENPIPRLSGNCGTHRVCIDCHEAQDVAFRQTAIHGWEKDSGDIFDLEMFGDMVPDLGAMKVNDEQIAFSPLQQLGVDKKMA